jgi:hypothetical protein
VHHNNEFGALARGDRRAMSRFYRTELRATDRFGSSEGLPRFVVIVEIPDHIIAILGNPSSSRLQAKAYEVAMDATWRQRVNAPNSRFQGRSNSLLLDTNPTDYGDANFKATDGCRAWIIESPLPARHGSFALQASSGSRSILISGRDTFPIS